LYARLIARSLWESLVSHLVGLVVVTNRRGAAIRRWSLILIGGILWAVLAYILHPYVPNSEPTRSLLEYPFRALFAPDVFKHVLIGAFVFWFAYRVAAIYLDDIFELGNVRIAERFIRQSAFASRYDVIEIKDGEVASKDQNSPIFLIGGPGKVRVYLENAALFEEAGGTSRVIEPTTPKSTQKAKQRDEHNESGRAIWQGWFSPLFRPNRMSVRSETDGAMILKGFERLRQVIDLRDLVEEFDVEARTRDGIPIRAKNLRVIFSVRRDGQEPSLEKPYPFNKTAIESLVYGMTREAWTDTMAAQIKRELVKFIARHTLSEFLAAIGRPEIEQAIQIEAELRVEADQLAGLDEPYEIDVPDPPPFVPRPAISDLFYDYNNFIAHIKKKGVELRWIGVGTWELPAEIIPAQHLQAWRITYENLARGSESALETILDSRRNEGLLNIIRDTPINTFSQIDPHDSSQRKLNMVKLVNGYRGKLHAALEVYNRRDQADTTQARRVREVWTHLAHVVAHFAGDI
jgi:hypothetical protein